MVYLAGSGFAKLREDDKPVRKFFRALLFLDLRQRTGAFIHKKAGQVSLSHERPSGKILAEPQQLNHLLPQHKGTLV